MKQNWKEPMALLLALLGLACASDALIGLSRQRTSSMSHEIVAKIEFTDAPTTVEVMQECGLYWVEGSAELLERVCSDRTFPDRNAAEAFMEEAKTSFRKSRPPNVTRWTIWTRPVAKKTAEQK